MKIKKALKEKSKLVAKLNDEIIKLHTYNSVEESSERAYDPRLSLDQAIQTMDQIIELKTKIHKANSKVYGYIFRLSELKSLVKNIKSMDCSTGKQTRWGGETPTIKTSVISVVERDLLVAKLEEQIEAIQELLDEHNSKTSI
jgi:hypothetical protein